jgi:hypothetical protein
MARSQFTANVDVRRWVGSKGDMILLMASARGLLPGASCQITVEQPGLKLEYDSPNEFDQQTTAADLHQITEVWALFFASGDDDGATVSIHFHPGKVRLSAPVSISVTGSDRTIVEGIKAQLGEIGGRGRRFPYTSGANIAGVIAGVMFVAWLVLNSTGTVYAWEPSGFTAWEGVLVYLGVLTLPSVPWLVLFPGFEWLTPDGRTRWDRSRRWVLRVVSGIIAGVIIASSSRIYPEVSESSPSHLTFAARRPCPVMLSFVFSGRRSAVIVGLNSS